MFKWINKIVECIHCTCFFPLNVKEFLWGLVLPIRSKRRWGEAARGFHWAAGLTHLESLETLRCSVEVWWRTWGMRHKHEKLLQLHQLNYRQAGRALQWCNSVPCRCIINKTELFKMRSGTLHKAKLYSKMWQFYSFLEHVQILM